MNTAATQSISDKAKAAHYLPVLRRLYEMMQAMTEIPVDERWNGHDDALEQLQEVERVCTEALDNGIREAARTDDTQALRRLTTRGMIEVAAVLPPGTQVFAWHEHGAEQAKVISATPEGVLVRYDESGEVFGTTPDQIDVRLSEVLRLGLIGEGGRGAEITSDGAVRLRPGLRVEFMHEGAGPNYGTVEAVNGAGVTIRAENGTEIDTHAEHVLIVSAPAEGGAA